MNESSEALMRDIREYNAQTGHLAFWWLGQLGYIVKTKSVTLCFDPFLRPGHKRTVPPPMKPEELIGMDYIFGSHDHSDHIDRTAWPGIAEASPGTRFVVPEKFVEPLNQSLGISIDRFVGLDEGKTFDDHAKNFHIRAIASAHEFLAPDPVTGLHDSLGYIVDADGLRIYHSGDTCKYEGLETKLIASRPIDLMYIPINGRDAVRYRMNCIGNMSFAEAVDLAGMVAPGLVVPGHYEMFTYNSEDPNKFMDYLAAKYPGQKAWIGEHCVKVEI